MTDVLDWPGWRQRPATRADLVRLIRLCDSLPLIDIVVPMVEPQDVDPAGHEVAGFLETFTNTTKHCLTAPLSAKTARAWLEMARIAADGTPLSESPVVSLVAAILPGLEIDAQSAGIMVLTAREGVPLVLMASCLAGGQTPITVAGSAALANAGTLAGLALAQCVRPGSPVLAYCGCQAMDLRACEISESGPENVLGTSVMSQLAKHYRLPTYACAADTDAKTGDVQAGMEKMGGMLGALADGIDVTINAGAINRASAASEVQLVVDHEMLRYLDRIERGVPVTEETLALDVIRSAGRRGSFLETEHTLRHMRKSETVYFELFDRTACRKPAEDLYARAKINCEELLNVWMSAVPAEVQNRLNDYVRNFK